MALRSRHGHYVAWTLSLLLNACNGVLTLRLAAELKGNVDRMICDPPFLSEDCQAKCESKGEYAFSNSTSTLGEHFLVALGPC